MVEIALKVDPLRPGWYLAEEVPNRASGALRWRNATRSHAWRPPTDVYETDEAVVVRVEIAGMRDEDISILLAGRLLTIRGLRPDVPERRAYHQMEIFFGEFISEVELPCGVIAEQARAEYKTGFLRLVLPKEAPNKIPVNG